MSNIVFARENTDVKDAPKRGWLIGSGPSQRIGQLIRCSLEQQLGARVTDVVSPRAHPESVLGASAFAGARHWALPGVAVAMQERCPDCSQQLAGTIAEPSIRQQAIAIPTLPIPAPALAAVPRLNGPLGFALGPFQVWGVPLQAQEWTTLLHHRASGVWFAPGLVWAARLVPEVRDAQVHQVRAALQELEQLAPLHLIPEQGRMGGLSQVQANAQYWRRLEAQTIQALRLGLADVSTLEVAAPASSAIAPSDPLVVINRNRHSLNQQRVWRQLEQIYFDAPTR